MIQRKNVLFATAIPLGWVLLNLMLKGWHCGSPSVNLDESFSLFHAQMPPANIVGELLQGNNPPLWELLLHAWIGVFGVGEFSARFLPTFFSSLAVLFIHRIGMEHQGIRQATVASALFTLSNYHMVFAHEARVYPLLVLLTSASFYAFQRNMREPAQGRWWVAWVASNVALLYSHYFGLFVLASQALLWLVNGKLRRNAMRQWLVCVGVLVVAYLPLMVVVVRRGDDAVEWPRFRVCRPGAGRRLHRRDRRKKPHVPNRQGLGTVGCGRMVCHVHGHRISLAMGPSADPQTVGHGLDVDAGRPSFGSFAVERPSAACNPNVDGVVCVPVACHVHGILLDPHVH